MSLPVLKDRREAARVLGCFGYFGFADGFDIKRTRLLSRGRRAGATGPCAICDRGQACWDRHRERTRAFVPDLCRMFDEIAGRHPGNSQGMFEEWFGKVGGGQPDPYTAVMSGNIEDGMLVRETGTPKSRGKATLTWPLEPLTEKAG